MHKETGLANGLAFEWGNSVGKSSLNAYTSGILMSSGWQMTAISSVSYIS